MKNTTSLCNLTSLFVAWLFGIIISLLTVQYGWLTGLDIALTSIVLPLLFQMVRPALVRYQEMSAFNRDLQAAHQRVYGGW